MEITAEIEQNLRVTKILLEEVTTFGEPVAQWNWSGSGKLRNRDEISQWDTEVSELRNKYFQILDQVRESKEEPDETLDYFSSMDILQEAFRLKEKYQTHIDRRKREMQR